MEYLPHWCVVLLVEFLVLLEQSLDNKQEDKFGILLEKINPRIRLDVQSVGGILNLSPKSCQYNLGIRILYHMWRPL